jgi:sugar phosphate permease
MNRWLMLGLGVAAQAAGCMFLYGLPFLLPTLRAETGLGLAQLGLLVGCPSIGMLFALVAWGAAADRYGERRVMAWGLAVSAVLLVGAGFARGPVPLGLLLVVAGAAGASVSAASGRVVLGWFPPERRGIAMGWRQSAQPLSLALAGLLLPTVAARSGVRGALLALAGICLLTAAAVAWLLADPPRPAAVPGERTGSPYRQPALWRVHGASALLVVPQFAVSAFALEYLVTRQHLTAPGAGRLLAVAGLAGAGARLAAGRWSDHLASRLRPMRWLALGNAAIVGLLAFAVSARAGAALVLMAVVATVSWNGLAFTAVAELAGHAWAGRAFGLQNTVQNLAVAGTPAVWGALIGAYGFGPGFAVAALVPLVAVLVTPREPAPVTLQP